jgi:hypothetical protein
MDQKKFEVVVCSLKPMGRLGEELRARGIRVVSLGGAGKFDLRIFSRLWCIIKSERPDIVQAFLFWANIAARLVGQLGLSDRSCNHEVDKIHCVLL